jgi:predicted nuclease with TOPRIM domain
MDSFSIDLVWCGLRQLDEAERNMSESTSLQSELKVLRVRHASALELMGERDEEVEELRADLAEIKQMYRDQVEMLINQLTAKGIAPDDAHIPV